MPKVFVYSDGGCAPNPGRGAYGVVQRYFDDEGVEHIRELGQGYLHSTNNRMELMGAITALETLQCPCDVILTTDSKYVVRGFTDHWVDYWMTHGWKTKAKKPASNRSLWERLVRAKERHLSVEFRWIGAFHNLTKAEQAQATLDAKYNDRCDTICHEQRAKADSELLVDPGEPDSY